MILYIFALAVFMVLICCLLCRFLDSLIIFADIGILEILSVIVSIAIIIFGIWMALSLVFSLK